MLLLSWLVLSNTRTSTKAFEKRTLQQVMEHREHDFVRVKIGNLSIYSCYAAPNMTTSKYCNILERLGRDAKLRRLTNPTMFVLSCQKITLVTLVSVNMFRHGQLGSTVDLTFAK